MITDLRTITILMLLAGISLGVFASTLLASRQDRVSPVLDPKLEAQVDAYRELYNLDEAGADRVRRELQSFLSKARQRKLDILQQHRAEFDALRDEALRRIERIAQEMGNAREVDAPPETGE